MTDSQNWGERLAKQAVNPVTCMTHDDQPDLQHAPAQHDRAVDDLLADTRALARQQKTCVLLQPMSPEVAQRIGRSLFEPMIAAEGGHRVELQQAVVLSRLWQLITGFSFYPLAF